MFFVVGTIHFYRGNIKPAKSVEDFRKKNAKLVQRVFDEGLTTFNYELSYGQVNQGIAAYLASPMNVITSETWTPSPQQQQD